MAQSKEQLQQALEKAKELELKAKLNRQKKEQAIKEREKAEKRRIAEEQRKKDRHYKIVIGGTLLKALGETKGTQEIAEFVEEYFSQSMQASCTKRRYEEWKANRAQKGENE